MEDDPRKLTERLDQLEESQKESEISFLRALKTLVHDYDAFQSGDRKNFPLAALWGVIFAYMRPRLIVTLAGIGAVALGGIQVWLLTNQNQLLDQQNVLLDAQRGSNMMEAVNSVLVSAKDEESERIAIAQLSAFGVQGFDVLVQLIKFDTRLSLTAAEALNYQAEFHTARQTERLLLELKSAVHQRLTRLRAHVRKWRYLRDGEGPDYFSSFVLPFYDLTEHAEALDSYVWAAEEVHDWEALDPNVRLKLRRFAMQFLHLLREMNEAAAIINDTDIGKLEGPLYDLDAVHRLADGVSKWCGSDIGERYMKIDWSRNGTSWTQMRDRVAQEHCPDFRMLRREETDDTIGDAILEPLYPALPSLE